MAYYFSRNNPSVVALGSAVPYTYPTSGVLNIRAQFVINSLLTGASSDLFGEGVLGNGLLHTCYIKFDNATGANKLTSIFYSASPNVYSVTNHTYSLNAGEVNILDIEVDLDLATTRVTLNGVTEFPTFPSPIGGLTVNGNRIIGDSLFSSGDLASFDGGLYSLEYYYNGVLTNNYDFLDSAGQIDYVYDTVGAVDLTLSGTTGLTSDDIFIFYEKDLDPTEWTKKAEITRPNTGSSVSVLEPFVSTLTEVNLPAEIFTIAEQGISLLSFAEEGAQVETSGFSTLPETFDVEIEFELAKRGYRQTIFSGNSCCVIQSDRVGGTITVNTLFGSNTRQLSTPYIGNGPFIVRAVWDGNDYQLYLGGVLKDSFTPGSQPIGDYGPFVLGNTSQFTGQDFDGFIYAAKISTNYLSTEYNFRTSTGFTLIDDLGGNNGTLVGFSDPTNTFTYRNGGADIRIAGNSDGTNRLPVHVEKFDTQTNEAVIRFRSLDLNVGQSFWLFYGRNGSIELPVSNPYGRDAVWAEYSFAPEFNTLTDSTGRSTRLSTVGTPTKIPAVVGNGCKFSSGADYLFTDTVGVVAGTFNMSFWYKRDGADELPASAYVFAIADSQDAFDNYAIILNGNFAQDFPSLDIQLFARNSSEFPETVISIPSFPSNGEVYVSVNQNLTGSTVTAIHNGVTYSGVSNKRLEKFAEQPLDRVSLNRLMDSSPSAGGLLILDEPRITLNDITRSADYIATEYENQSSPATFWSTGVPESTVVVASNLIALIALELEKLATVQKSADMSSAIQVDVDAASIFGKVLNFSSLIQATLDSGANVSRVSTLIAALSLNVNNTAIFSKILNIVATEAFELEVTSTVTKIVDLLVENNLTLNSNNTFEKVIGLLAAENTAVDINSLAAKIVDLSSTAPLELNKSAVFNKVVELLSTESISIDSDSSFQKIITLIAANGLEVDMLAALTRIGGGSNLSAIIQLALDVSSQSSKKASLTSVIELDVNLLSSFSKTAQLTSLSQIGLTATNTLAKQTDFAVTSSIDSDFSGFFAKQTSFSADNSAETNLAGSFTKIAEFAVSLGMQLDLLSAVERATQVGEFLARMFVEVSADSSISKTAELESLENDLSVLATSAFGKSIDFESLKNLSLDTASDFGKNIALSSALSLDLSVLAGSFNKTVGLSNNIDSSVEAQANFVKESILSGDLSLDTIVESVLAKSSDMEASQLAFIDLSASIFAGVLLNIRRVYYFEGKISSIRTFSGNVIQDLTFKGVVND